MLRSGLHYRGFILCFLLQFWTMQAGALQKSTPSVGEVERGQAVFKTIVHKYPFVRLMPRFGALTANPRVALFIPKQEWAALSFADKVSLTRYVESQVQAAGLCAGCWLIGVGDLVGNDDMSIDKTVVQGDSAWEKDDPCCRGVKVSDFRQRTPQVTKPNVGSTKNARRDVTPAPDGARCERERLLCKTISQEFDRINREPYHVAIEEKCTHVRKVCANVQDSIRRLHGTDLLAPEMYQMLKACKPLLEAKRDVCTEAD